MPGYAIQQQNEQMNTLLASQFRLLYNPIHAFSDSPSINFMLPALRGFWPGSSVGPTGEMNDLSSNGLLLTNNSTSLFGIDGLIPYTEYDGTADYHSHVDAADFDITGTEAYIVNPGLTLGCWFYPDAVATTGLITKWNAVGNNRSYALTADGIFQVSNTGAVATNTVTSSLSPTASQWNFIAGRFTPSTELAIWVDDTETDNTTTITASIFNSASIFAIGAFGNPAAFYNGKVSLAFLCAAALPDIFINTFYQMTAPLFKTSI